MMKNGAATLRTTIDREGRIALDRDVQAKLGVGPGDEVVLESRGAEVLIRSARTEGGLELEGNVVVHRGVCAIPADQILAEMRVERFDKLTNGLTE